MNPNIQISSKHSAVFIALLILSFVAATIGFALPTKQEGGSKVIVILSENGEKFYKVNVGPTGNFTSPKLPKGLYTFTVRSAPQNPESSKPMPETQNSTTTKQEIKNDSEPSHITFSATKGMIIFVGGKPATGKLTFSDQKPVTVYISQPGITVSGVLD